MSPDKNKVINELKLIHGSLFQKGDETLTREEQNMIEGASKYKNVCFCHSSFSKMHRSVLLWVLFDSERRKHSHVVLSLQEVNDIRFGVHPEYTSLSALKNKHVVVYFNGDYKVRGIEEVLGSLATMGLNSGVPVVFFYIGTKKSLSENFPVFLNQISKSNYILCDLAKAKDWWSTKKDEILKEKQKRRENDFWPKSWPSIDFFVSKAEEHLINISKEDLNKELAGFVGIVSEFFCLPADRLSEQGSSLLKFWGDYCVNLVNYNKMQKDVNKKQPFYEFLMNLIPKASFLSFSEFLDMDRGWLILSKGGTQGRFP